MIPLDWYEFWRSLRNKRFKNHQDMLGYRVCDLVDDYVRAGEGSSVVDRCEIVKIKLSEDGVFEFCAVADFFLMMRPEGGGEE